MLKSGTAKIKSASGGHPAVAPERDSLLPDASDLDCGEHIDSFVDHFYQHMLADPQLAPIFIEIAAIDVEVHLPHIKRYWRKLLLGDNNYHRHTMKIHRQVHSKRPLQTLDFERWLSFFVASVDSNYAGPKADKAKKIAAVIAGNMQLGLE